MAEVIEELTEKEKETLRLILRGHDAKSSAQALDLSVHTINERLRTARRKLCVTSSREAARLLHQHESAAPNSLAYKQLGDEHESPPPNPPTMPEDSHTDEQGHRRIGAILIGGGTFMTITIAIAYALSSPGVFTAVADTANTEITPAVTAEDQPDPDPAMLAQTEPKEVVLEPLEALARDWLRLIEDGNLRSAFDTSGMPKSIDYATFEAAMATEISPLGQLRSRTFEEFGSIKSAGADYRFVRFISDFENGKGVIETVTMTSGDSGYEVGGYFVDKSAARPAPDDAELDLAARAWLALVDAQDWQASFDGAARAFRQPNTVESWRMASELARAPLGKITKRTAIAFEDLGGSPSGYKAVKFASDFALRDGVTETVTLTFEDGEWRPVGYFIS